MEQEGLVSLWVGNFKSSKDFKKYIADSYTVDGDIIPSNFSKDFEIDYFDEDLKEVDYLRKADDRIDDLLKGFSFDNNIIPQFQYLKGNKLSGKINTIILLYNFEYKGNIKKIDLGPYSIEFVGSVHYSK